MLPALWTIPAAAAPDPAVLRAVWDEAVPWLAAASELPVPPLEPADLDRLAAGGIVRRRLDEPPHARNGVDTVMGVAWLAIPPVAAWIGALDDAHAGLVDGLVEQQLPGTTPARKILYQRIDLPFPITDRHWVIEIHSNPDLFERSHGRVWERAWRIDARGPGALADLPPASAPASRAVWTPVNEGAWLLLEAAGGSLVVYRVRTDIGGFVPPDLVARWTLGTLEEFFAGMERLARRVPQHYRGDHETFLRPDGTPIPVPGGTGP